MAIEFINPLTAGTVLVRSDIRSQNFVSGSAGWIIEADGDAEFNSVIIRGGTVVSGLALYYDGPPALGNLILSISADAGTDAYGNTYLAGLGVYSSDGVVNALGSEFSVTGSNGSAVNILTGGVGQATVDMVPRDLGGTVWGSGSIFTTLGASNRPALALSSPNADANPINSSVEFYGGGPTTSDTYILFSADRVNISDDLDVTGNLTAGNLQSGTAQTAAPGGAPAQTSVAVAFPVAFTSTPVVVVTDNSAAANLNTSNIRWSVSGKSTTGFTINCWRDTNNATNFEWIAYIP